MSRSQHPSSGPAIVLLGGGVHAVVVADCIRARGLASIVGYTDHPDHDPTHMRRMSIDYLGDDEVISRLVKRGIITGGVLGQAGLTHTALRRRLVERFKDRIPQWWTAIHPSATVASTAKIAEGTVIFAQAVVNPLATIGRHVVINTGGVIEHHCEIGDFAVISPHATICGYVRVSESVFIGAGAIVITDLTIGKGSVVGAGSVVIRDVPENVIVAGNPARVIRKRNPASTPSCDALA